MPSGGTVTKHAPDNVNAGYAHRGCDTTPRPEPVQNLVQSFILARRQRFVADRLRAMLFGFSEHAPGHRG